MQKLKSLTEAFVPGQKYALLFDIDLTLMPSMSTDIKPEQTQLIFSLYDQLDGGLCMMTGRPGDSVDKCFSGIPASVEHHSAWRPQRNGEWVALAPKLDTTKLSAQAVELINGFLPIFESSAQVVGPDPGVFVERKKHAMALVHSGSITHQQREILEATAENILESSASLQLTHRVARGSDAVEIVPLHGMQGQKLDKGVALHQFMDLPNFKGRIPVVFGDSGTDLKAMHAAREYGGFGVAVGTGIPDDPVVQMRLNHFSDTWPMLQQLQQFGIK